MEEVSCRVFGMAFDGLKTQDIPFEQLVEGMPTSLEVLQDPKQRVDWEVFVRIVERLEVLLGGPAALVELGQQNFHNSPGFRFMRKVARVFVRPRDLYWMGTTWFGRSLFSTLQDSFDDLPDGRVREVVRISEQHRDCPQLFHIMRGALMAAPRLLKHPDAVVDMELEPRQATYTITPPGQARFQSSPLKALTSRYSAWELMEAMSEQQVELNRSHAELAETLEELARRTETLRRINELGRELGRHVEPAELAQELEKTLAQHLPNSGIALWVEPIDGGLPELLCRQTHADGPPAVSYELRNGDRLVGRLDIWGSDPADERSKELLEDLTPWITLGLDNARAHAAAPPDDPR